MKKIIAYFIFFTFPFSHIVYAQEDYTDDHVYYSDEEDELFNRGKFVGKESDEVQLAKRRIQARNWKLAVGTTIVGIITVFLVQKN